MRYYVVIAIVAYLAFSVNSVIDKFLLKKTIPKPAVYAFYIGILSGIALLLFPFGLTVPSWKILGLALVSGAAFILALLAFFEGLKREDASRVLPSIGAMVPAFTFVLSAVIVGERLLPREIWGLAVLTAGTLLISGWNPLERKKKVPWFRFAALAALLFALSFTFAKAVYLDQSFISGLIWTRVGMVLAALSFLLFPSFRRDISQTTQNINGGSKVLFLSGQLLAAGGGLLQNYAVSMGSVTLVNALQSTQFAFLFLLTLILSLYFPKILLEDISKRTLVKKAASLVVISVGLFLIA
jgi:drug/metabolite transporter (DMT)-like permease